MLFDENGQRNVVISVENADSILESTLHTLKGKAKISHRITRFKGLKNNEQVAVIDLFAIQKRRKNVCRALVNFNKHQHVIDVVVLFGDLTEKFFEINYVRQGRLFLPDRLAFNDLSAEKSSRFISSIGGLKQNVPSLKNFAFDSIFQKEFIEYLRYQKDQLEFRVCHVSRKYTTFLFNSAYKNLLENYIQNELVDDLLGYKTVSSFVRISIFNQVENDLKKIGENFLVDRVIIDDFLEKMKPMLLLSDEKQEVTIGNLDFSTKEFKEKIESMQQQVAKYEKLYQSNKPNIRLIVYISSVVKDFIKDYIKNRFVFSFFGYSNFLNFFSVAAINQIRNDLKKISAFFSSITQETQEQGTQEAGETLES